MAGSGITYKGSASYKKSVLDAADWIWGVVEGGFNEQQTTSQIIVDAVIGMIPLVGDVTAARDLIAVSMRLIDDPKKREEKLQWVELVLLIFALIPVVGGVIKGVGRIALKQGAKVAASSDLINEVVKVLNHVGRGDAVTWFKNLDVMSYAGDVQAKFGDYIMKLEQVVDALVRKLRSWLPESMVQRLLDIREKLKALRAVGERMIPEALKELAERLRTLQSQIYRGEWHSIPVSAKSWTMESEARLLTEFSVVPRAVEKVPFPGNRPRDFVAKKGWPDLRNYPDSKTKELTAITGFHGAMKPVRIPAGTRIFRVIEVGTNSPGGRWWCYRLPDNGLSWRQDFAVLNSFQNNGHYVELVVPPGGLHAWEGTVATQIERNPAKPFQNLKGGGTQLFIPFDHPINAHAAESIEAAPIRETKWTSHMDVGFGERTSIVEPLSSAERASKKGPLERPAAASAAAARGVRDKRRRDTQEARE